MNNFDSNMFYNIARFDISKGLKDEELSSGADFFILLKVPTNANVTVKINSNTNHPIPVREAWQIGSKNELKLYISCDPVENEEIVIGQHDGNLSIITNPTIEKLDSISTIGNFSSTLLSKLDKVVNPYLFSTSSSHISTATSNTLVLSKTLNCDKIILASSTRRADADFSASFILIDDVPVLSVTAVFGGVGVIDSDRSAYLELTNIRGKNIKIYSQFHAGILLQEFNLKV